MSDHPLVTSAKVKPGPWNEVFGKNGLPRPTFAPLIEYLQKFRPPELRILDDRMEATLREMGVTLDVIRKDPWGQQAWACDLLPQIFDLLDWQKIVRGLRQRLKAFELFLADVYGKKEILRQGVIPIQPVLGSPQYQNVSIGLPRTQGAYLHLSGLCIVRDPRGALTVRHHHFGHAAGISYMMQNRRALARVAPDLFQESAVQSLAQAPQAIMEKLRYTRDRENEEPSVVLLSPGPGSPIYSEHSFLARRMGVPLVQGDDLLVLEDRLYLKTVQGLRRVDAVYTRVADDWLDPLVFRKESRLGVPGLIHCLRKGTVSIFNSIGSQLADDRSLLCFASQIIRYYLAEDPILPTIQTFWMGDIDQREMVLGNIDAYEIRPIFGRFVGATEARVHEEEIKEIRNDPGRFVAQPADCGAKTVCFKDGKRIEGVQDHIVFALRDGDAFDVFPGALTRVFPGPESTNSFPLGWTSKDTWVLGDEASDGILVGRVPRYSDAHIPPRQVTSRVAEAFYWMGRYLERAYHQAYLIQVIETLETEELNSAERKLYRPLWNRLLPPLEKSAGISKRSIANRTDRYRLVLLPEPGSVVSTFMRAVRNAESMQECLSPEAWASLSDLRSRFARSKYRKDLPEIECGRIARRLSETATKLIPQFYAIASRTMLGDDGWRFCEVAEMLERAIITANSVLSISKSFEEIGEASRAHAVEIELSAFLRLMGTRDAYRRVYQMRAEPIRVLEMFWQNTESPRSVMRCLSRCASLLRESSPSESGGLAKTLTAIEDLVHRIKRIDWQDFVRRSVEEDAPRAEVNPGGEFPSGALTPLLTNLLNAITDLHHVISDGFLSHQAYIAGGVQTVLKGFSV